MSNKNNKWPIYLLFQLIIGVILLLLVLFEVSEIFSSSQPERQIDSIKGAAMMLLLAVVCLFPVYEVFRKNIYGKKTYYEKFTSQYIAAREALPNNKAKLKVKKIKATGLIALFIIIMFAPFFWPHSPTYKFSNNTLILLWLIIFPTIWINWRSLTNLDIKNIFTFPKFFLSLLLIIILVFYIEIIQSYINVNENEIYVDIREVDSSRSCKKRVDVKDHNGIQEDFCADNLKYNNLVKGIIIYIDNGDSVLKVREGWFGTVVDSITWRPTYSSYDRRWLKDKKKFIYLNNE